jgi:hypothetical protein
MPTNHGAIPPTKRTTNGFGGARCSLTYGPRVVNVTSRMAAQTMDMNTANVACFGVVGVDGIGCGGRLPLKIATSKAATIKTAIEITGKICIEKSSTNPARSMTQRRLKLTGLSYNAGVDKYFFSTLLHPLRDERHFALLETSAIPTKARS